MVTNFSHMKNESLIYEEMLRVEDLLVDGTGKLDYIYAMRGIRSALETIVLGWIKIANVNVESGKEHRRTRMFECVCALQESGGISKETKELIEKIRRKANKAVHYGEHLGIQKATTKELYDNAVEMYEKFYQLSYVYLEAKQKQRREKQ